VGRAVYHTPDKLGGSGTCGWRDGHLELNTEVYFVDKAKLPSDW
jgi:hypothetical protein